MVFSITITITLPLAGGEPVIEPQGVPRSAAFAVDAELALFPEQAAPANTAIATATAYANFAVLGDVR